MVWAQVTSHLVKMKAPPPTPRQTQNANRRRTGIQTPKENMGLMAWGQASVSVLKP